MSETKTFTLDSGSVGEWYWCIVARIKENGTFDRKGSIQFHENTPIFI